MRPRHTMTEYPQGCSISISSIGVQIVRQNCDSAPVGVHEPGSGMWDVLEEMSRKFFGDCKEIVGKKLVRVDVSSWESQWSFV